MNRLAHTLLLVFSFLVLSVAHSLEIDLGKKWNGFSDDLQTLPIIHSDQSLSDNPKGTVIVFVSQKCPCSNSHRSEIESIQKAFRELNFLLLHSDAKELPEEVIAHFSSWPFEVRRDQGQRLANRLGAHKTPHAFFITANDKLIYRGGLTDSQKLESAKSFFLRDYLTRFLKNGQKNPKEVRSLGCAIARSGEYANWPETVFTQIGQSNSGEKTQ